MRVLSSEAIVLRHLDYGEADRIVTFLTPGHGCLRGFARSARKSRRRFGPSLEPFAQVRMHWTDRPGDLVSLREADLLDLRSGLYADLVAMALAGYGCELLQSFLGEQHGHTEAFDLLRAFLDHLAGHGAAPETRLLFELRLLVLAGYAPHLLHCSECGGPLDGEEAVFDAARGGSLCRLCAGPAATLHLSPLTLGTLAKILRGPPTLFAGFRFSDRTREEGAEVISSCLRQHLARPPKSLAFLDRVSREEGPESGG